MTTGDKASGCGSSISGMMMTMQDDMQDAGAGEELLLFLLRLPLLLLLLLLRLLDLEPPARP